MNSANRIITVLFVAFLAGCSTVRDQMAEAKKTPQQKFAQALHEPLHRLESKGATLAARVVDVNSGEVLYEENPDTAVIPASNGKLAISATALDIFGAGHTFKTYLVYDVPTGHLWVIGTGDPGVGDPKIAEAQKRTPTSVFDDWTAALKRRGLTNIKGNLYYWDGAFDRELVHPNWKKDFLVDWYAAPVSGLNFNDNCIDVTATATEPGSPAKLTVVPPNTVATIKNETITDGEGAPEVTRAADEPIFTLKGGIKDKAKFESKPITDPGEFFANALRTHLKDQGINIAGETLRAETLPFGPTGPMYERIVATHETSIVDILKRINKNSQNMFAEAMSKAMGREMMFRQNQSVPGSWALGEEAAKKFLWGNGINAGSFVAVDGSGLARENRVTARLITDLMVLMNRHRHAKVWKDSLAVGGVDGTIGKRLKDIPGVVMAKTGYIGGVRSLSGYVKNKNGKLYAFCFIYNNIDGSVKPYEELQDDAMRVLYYWPEKPIYPQVEVAPEPAPTTAPADDPTTAPVVVPATAPTTP